MFCISSPVASEIFVHVKIYLLILIFPVYFRLLNAELEAKTADLVRQAEQLMVRYYPSNDIWMSEDLLYEVNLALAVNLISERTE